MGEREGREGGGDGMPVSENASVTRGLRVSSARATSDAYFIPGSFQTDADVTSSRGCPRRNRAHMFSCRENYCLLYAGRARAKSDLANDAGIILMARDDQRAD
ncbi:unnamed protein product [Lasius platythorax]|uniref:Uncharacterized protein n=1 Tax=Lasius platythorax TaxID=488582 RepID=A0AAV2P1B9_9HYME